MTSERSSGQSIKSWVPGRGAWGAGLKKQDVFASFVSWHHTLRGTLINWCASWRKSGLKGQEAGAWERDCGECTLQASPAGVWALGAGGWCRGVAGRFPAQPGRTSQWRGPGMTQRKEGGSKLRHGPLQSRSGHQEGAEQVGFCGPFPLRFSGSKLGLAWRQGAGPDDPLTNPLGSRIPLLACHPWPPALLALRGRQPVPGGGWAGFQQRAVGWVLQTPTSWAPT